MFIEECLITTCFNIIMQFQYYYAFFHTAIVKNKRESLYPVERINLALQKETMLRRSIDFMLFNNY